MNKQTLLSAAICLAASPALSQEFLGGSVAANYSFITEDNSDSDGISLKANGAFSITPLFAVGGSLSSYDANIFGDRFTNLTLHGLYRLSDNISVGAFAGFDMGDGETENNYGIEFGAADTSYAFEGYYGIVDADDVPDSFDFSIFGISGGYDVGSGFGVIGGYHSFTTSVDSDYVRLSVLSIGGSYDFGNGAEVYAEIGSRGNSIEIDGEDTSDSSGFIGIGARFALGEETGTVLGSRSIFEGSYPF